MQPNEISEILSKEYFKADRKYHDSLKFQITGKSKEAQTEIIRGFESKHIKDVRDKYSTPINWLWEWILQPINKIFSSNGGSIIINDSNDKAKEELLLKCANLNNSGSLRDWMQKTWKENYIDCPAGVVLMEYSEKETWPIFYSIDEIKYYKLNGRYIDTIIFNPFEAIVGGKKVKLVRVIDGEFDTVYKQEGKNLVEIELYKDSLTGEEKQGKYKVPVQFSKVNGKGGVPAFIIGDIPDNTKGKVKLSLIDKQLQLGIEYYQLDTIRVFAAIKNGYGTYYWYTRPCKECAGNGFIGEEKTEDNTCKVCGGAGRIYPKNVNDIYLMDVGTDEKLPEKPGGIIEGDIAGWKQYIEQLSAKEQHLELSFWSTHRTESGSNNTATGAFVDSQAASDKLDSISASAEIAESIIFRYLGAFHSNTFEGGYIVYGRRHQIESPDTIWKKYEDARKNGAPESSLNNLLLDYYESKYKNDYQNRNRCIKLMAVEPFVHLSLLDVLNNNSIGQDQKNNKLYYSEWENQLQTNDVINSSVEELKKNLNEFIKSKDLDSNQIKENGKEENQPS
jgi:hypothetical protein